jgi:hypothetical protein
MDAAVWCGTGLRAPHAASQRSCSAAYDADGLLNCEDRSRMVVTRVRHQDIIDGSEWSMAEQWRKAAKNRLCIRTVAPHTQAVV